MFHRRRRIVVGGGNAVDLFLASAMGIDAAEREFGAGGTRLMVGCGSGPIWRRRILSDTQLTLKSYGMCL